MNWLILALFAPIFDTVANFIDKYLIGDKVKDTHVLTLYMALVGLLAGCVVWIFNGFQTMRPEDIALTLTAGVLTYTWMVFYFKALEEEETSIVILLFQLSPVLTMVLSYLFLNESIDMQQLLGFVLILAASTSVSLKETDNGTYKLGKAFWYVNAVNVLWAISAILMKSVLARENFITILPFEGFGVAIAGLGALIINQHIRTSFLHHLRHLKGYTVSAIILNEFVSLAGKWITILAISLGPVALVDVVAGVQVFYGILLGWILTTLYPTIFKESITKKSVVLKFTAACALFYGLYLLG